MAYKRSHSFVSNNTHYRSQLGFSFTELSITMEKNYRNTGFVLLLLIPLMLIGFFPSYLSQLVNSKKSIHFLIHLHFWVAAIWIILMIVQPFLIRFKHNRLHKQLGKLSYLLFVLFELSLIPFIIGHFRYALKSGSPTILISALLGLIFTGVLFGLAMFHRKTSSLHMRYMIALAFMFLFPPVGRIIIRVLGGSFLAAVHVNFTLINLILLALIFLDKKHQRNYQPYLVGLSVFIFSQVSLHTSFVVFGL